MVHRQTQIHVRNKYQRQQEQKYHRQRFTPSTCFVFHSYLSLPVVVRKASQSFYSSYKIAQYFRTAPQFFQSKCCLKMMRALVQENDGDTDTFKVRSDIPKPTPSANQALIKVYAAALNPIDIWRGRGALGPDTFPRICGYDFAGVVEEVNYGAEERLHGDMKKVKKGDRVFGDVMKNSLGRKNGVLGTVAEWCICDVDLLGVLGETDDRVDMVGASGMGLVCMTAMQCFQDVGLKKGENVLVLGGSGGVGLHAMMLAKRYYEAGKVACTASAASMGLCKDKAGADIVVDYKEEDVARVLEGWADVTLDCAGQFDAGKKTLKTGGRLISIVSASFRRDDVESLALAPTEHDVELLARLLKEGKITPIVDTVYKMDDAIKAVQHMASGRAKGKIIIQIGDE